MDEPGEFLKKASCAIGDFLVYASGFVGVDFPLAELLFSGIETWRMVSVSRESEFNGLMQKGEGLERIRLQESSGNTRGIRFLGKVSRMIREVWSVVRQLIQFARSTASYPIPNSTWPPKT